MNKEKIQEELAKVLEQKFIDTPYTQALENQIVETANNYVKHLIDLGEFSPNINITLDPCLTAIEKAEGKLNFIIS